MTASCDACGGKTAAPVCPHCGHRRGAAGAGLAGTPLTKDEQIALLAMTAPPRAPELKPIAAYLLPEHGAGASHTAEMALTVVTAPLWTLGLFGFAWVHMRHRSGTLEPMGERAATWTIAAFGAPLLWGVAAWGLGPIAAAGVAIGQLGAWLARSVVRGRADRRAAALLSKLDQPAPAPAPLPLAVAQPRPAAPAPAPAPIPPRLEPTATPLSLIHI